MNKVDMYNLIKGALKSWTIWFNAVGVPILMYLDSSSALWQEYAGDNATGIVLIINIILRFKTTNSLGNK